MKAANTVCKMEKLKTNSLPSNWVIADLDLLLERISNGSSAKQYNQKVGHPITRIETISYETIDLNRVKYVKETSTDFIGKYKLIVGDILFSHINSDSHLGKTAIFKNKDLILIHGINLLLLRPNKFISSDYIIYHLKCYKYKGKYLDLAQRAVNQSSINQRKLKSLPIKLPPFHEQHRIVAKIEELFSDLDNAIESLKKAKEQLITYRQAVLKWAFEGKLTEQWRKENNPEPAEKLLERIKEERERQYQVANHSSQKKPKRLDTSYKESNKPSYNLPKNWKWCQIKDIFSVLTDYHANGSYEKLKSVVRLLDKPNYAIMVRTTNLVSGNFNTNLKYIDEEAYNFLYKSKLFGEEILIGKIGNAGKAYYMPKLKKPASLAMNLFLLRFNHISPKYIFYHLISSFSKHDIAQYVKGVGNPTIDKKSIRSLLIALPPVEEQFKILGEIESRLSVCDNIEANITETMDKAEALRQSILKTAFEGKLVSQDQNDEPAWKLLERIKAEKESTQVKVKKSKNNQLGLKI